MMCVRTLRPGLDGEFFAVALWQHCITTITQIFFVFTMNHLKQLLAGILICSIVQTASSISCFSCEHTDSDSVCEDNLIECDASAASLGMIRVAAFKPTMQIIQSSTFRCFDLLIQDTPNEYRTRGCAYDTVDVCQGEVRVGVQAECRWCNEHDGCNSAGKFQTNVFLLLAVVLSMGVIQKMF
ncbi:uncharacterized protein LOC118517543 [Anopheles stephensi]|uniref:uncharacterized protein LOC118517543 n=1 Tax=Anopheles stephensi TaxID=30069 RepID=UPI001658A97D|nr:uncharacterized protein LOC118517543 [Anopheles stephensi]